MLLQNIRTAFDALFNNRLRSFLTLLGVVIGVFAVTTTISMGAIAIVLGCRNVKARA